MVRDSWDGEPAQLAGQTKISMSRLTRQALIQFLANLTTGVDQACRDPNGRARCGPAAKPRQQVSARTRRVPYLQRPGS